MTTGTRRRPNTTAGGAIAVVVGSVATAVGAGLGLPHLTEQGAGAGTLIGIVALVAGLVLLVWGAVTLVRPLRRRWARAGITAVVLLVALLGLRTLGVAVAATHVPPTDVGDRSPADVVVAVETVTVTTPDGVDLAAWWVPSTNGAAVVLLHGAGSTRANVLDHLAVLSRNGYGVLALDARGHGDSDGRAMDFGWWGERDVAGAVTFLAAQPGVEPDRIAAVGMSMGGEEALGALGADARLAAVVAEGATGRTAADGAWLSERYGIRGWLQRQIDRVTYGWADLLTPAPAPGTLRDAVRSAAPRPVLLIAAGDAVDEQHAAEHIRAGSPDSVEVWVAAGAGHVGALDTHPVEWEERVAAFLDAAIGGADQSTPDST